MHTGIKYIILLGTIIGHIDIWYSRIGMEAFVHTGIEYVLPGGTITRHVAYMYTKV